MQHRFIEDALGKERSKYYCVHLTKTYPKTLKISNSNNQRLSYELLRSYHKQNYTFIINQSLGYLENILISIKLRAK